MLVWIMLCSPYTAQEWISDRQCGRLPSVVKIALGLCILVGSLTGAMIGMVLALPTLLLLSMHWCRESQAFPTNLLW